MVTCPSVGGTASSSDTGSPSGSNDSTALSITTSSPPLRLGGGRSNLGGSLMDVTVTVTIASLELSAPSLTVYANVSVPLRSRSGV